MATPRPACKAFRTAGKDDAMNYRKLGKNGPQVSLVGLGCNNFGMRVEIAGARSVIHKALDLGITLFDTADIYGKRGGSETMLGQILGDRRKDIVLATKFGGPMNDEGTMKGASRSYILSEVEASLARLKTDWIDLYQIHFKDPLTPMEETLRALDDLVRQGKVRYIGCSNHAAWQVVDAQWIAKQFGLAAFISCQDEYSLLVRGVERELLPAMQVFDLGLLPYFPLASGLLTGKYKRDVAPGADTRFAALKGLTDRYATETNWQIVERLEKFCAQKGHGLLELAFSWLASRPTVASIIAGATKPEQLEQNAAAVGWALTAEDLAEIDRITAK
jgi:aryl-alcohol dehydrogenase-like predicted oxidoreductase